MSRRVVGFYGYKGFLPLCIRDERQTQKTTLHKANSAWLTATLTWVAPRPRQWRWVKEPTVTWPRIQGSSALEIVFRSKSFRWAASSPLTNQRSGPVLTGRHRNRSFTWDQKGKLVLFPGINTLHYNRSVCSSMRWIRSVPPGLLGCWRSALLFNSTPFKDVFFCEP